MEKEKNNYKNSMKTEDLNTRQSEGSKETWIPGQVDLKLLSKHNNIQNVYHFTKKQNNKIKRIN